MSDQTQTGRPPQRDGTVPLGHWGPVPVVAHWSVLVTVTLFVVLLARVTLPDVRPGSSPTAYWTVAVVTAVVFMATLLLHELAHAAVARAHGMPVRRVTLWLLGGVTELGGESPSPRVEAQMAAVGPGASLATSALGALLALVIGTETLVGAALIWLCSVNVVLAVFNLLPGAPLDGGRLLHALVWWRTGDRDRAGNVAAWAGRALGYVLLTIGLLNVLWGFPQGWWLVLVGWFIVSGSLAEQAALSDHHLTGFAVADVMRPAHPAPGWWTFDRLMARIPAEAAASGVVRVVDLDGRTAGVLTLRDLERVPATGRPALTLGELAARRSAPLRLAPTDDLGAAVRTIREARGAAVVEQDGRPVGVVTADDLARVTRLTRLGWRSEHLAAGGPR